MTDDIAAGVPVAAAGDELARRLPELLRAASAAPSAAHALCSERLDRAGLAVGPRLRAAIALRLAEIEECAACAELRAQDARRAGLSADEVRLARQGRWRDERGQALLALASKLARQRGHHVRLVIDAARARGVGAQELAEVVALVALQIFLGYLGELAPPPEDAGEPGEPHLVR